MRKQIISVVSLVDFDDWQIMPEFFLRLEDLWGPHTAACFANFYTAKLRRFFSRFWTFLFKI